MTGAATVVWFLAKRPKSHRPRRDTRPVDIGKPESRVEAEQAVRESAARSNAIARQRGAVTRLVSSLAEVRRNNHFADNIRSAYGGGEQ